MLDNVNIIIVNLIVIIYLYTLMNIWWFNKNYFYWHGIQISNLQIIIFKNNIIIVID